jgi:hypothetical protein
MQFSHFPRHPTHWACPPPPSLYIETETGHLKVNFLSHFLSVTTGSTGMWTIGASTNNTHWATIMHSRCKDWVCPKNQVYSLHLLSTAPQKYLSCAPNVPTLIVNFNRTQFFNTRCHILKRNKIWNNYAICWIGTVATVYIKPPEVKCFKKTT